MRFEEIASMENLFEAWEEFICGKRKKKDVQEFAFRLGDEIADLHADLMNGNYVHGPYKHFRINDPKSRDIHKATVRDRLVHHAVHRKLYPFFANQFIADSFSCQTGKGLHRALERFKTLTRKVSKNNSRTCWVLKCDIRKFFASIDHEILMEILWGRIGDGRVVGLLEGIVESFPVCSFRPPFCHSREGGNLSSVDRSGMDSRLRGNDTGEGGYDNRCGLPLGNLTSQLFANIYMDEFDQYVKRDLGVDYYVRYADDFIFFSHDRQELLHLLPRIAGFLSGCLSLDLHPKKVFIKTFASGVDFLGWTHFPHHSVLRTKTKHRMKKRVRFHPTRPTLHSYLGLLSHGNARQLSEGVRGMCWLLAPK